MDNQGVTGQLHVAIRSTGDFRFKNDPTLFMTSGEEIGFFAPADATWDRTAIKNSLGEILHGVEPRQVSDRHVQVEAGASFEALQFLAEIGSAYLGGITLEGTVTLVRIALRKSRNNCIAETVAAFSSDQYEQTAIDAVRQRFDIVPSQITVDSVETSRDGKGTVELSIPERGERYEVGVELDGDGLRQYRMKKVNAT
jgi:hypothetical protein